MVTPTNSKKILDDVCCTTGQGSRKVSRAQVQFLQCKRD